MSPDILALVDTIRREPLTDAQDAAFNDLLVAIEQMQADLETVNA